MNPASEYSKRLQSRTETCDRDARLHRKIGNLRLAVGISAAIITYFVFARPILSPWWFVVPVVIFIALAVWHSRVIERRDRAARAVRFYEKGIQRFENRWMGQGEPGERYREPDHVYADDLDVFGRGSLFELLCTARTQAGEAILASWLKAPAETAEEVVARQEAVAELREQLDLREELAALADVVRKTVNPDALAVWAEKPPVRFPPGTRIVAPLIVAVVLGTFSLWMADITSRTPFLVAILVESAIGLALRSRVREIIEAAEHPARDLDLLSDVLRTIEARRFNAPLLTRIRSRLETKGEPASRQIRRLHTLISRLDDRANEFFAPIAAALLWGTQFSIAVESWRQRSGSSVRRWLEAVGEFEALCSFAGYSFEHPNDPFPVLVAGNGSFDAGGLGHPLLPEASFIRNNIQLGALRLIIVSGSNMSGKSTLLRSIGLNTVLAWAGAPVRATRLELSPLQVGASMRIVDSLQDGRSRFYAEITRLRQIMDLAGRDRTLLFLVDEMLSGTNSHDRLIGAEGLVRTLVERGAIGLITTHDLALAHIADALGDRALNVHFSDTIVDGRLSFDYRLRPGIVEHSNALELMRSVGLDV